MASENATIAGKQSIPRGLLAVGALLTALYMVVPYGRFAGALYVVATALAALAIVAAVRYRSLFRPLAWLLVATALALAAIGHAIWYWLDLRGLEPFPSLADGFYLAVYPLFIAALWNLGVARDYRDGALSDALIVGISAAVLGWALLIAPFVQDPGLTLGQLLVSAGYPVADLVLLPFILRLLFLRQTRLTAHLYLLAGMLAYFAADMLYALGNSAGWYAPGGFTDAGWLVAYTLFAAAAWHGSATREPSARVSGETFTMRRLYILGGASVLVPAVILVTAGTDMEIVRVAAIASILLFLLIMQRMAGLLRETRRQAEALRHLSLTDPLTGAANRRRLDEELGREMAYAHRYRMPLTLAYADLDHFKRYNDTHGHAAGDVLLQELVARWSQTLRPSDILARVGGEEFVLVFPGNSLEEAQSIMGRLCGLVPYGQSCSAGLVSYSPGESAEALMGRADAGLYRAKEGGRNRVVTVEAAEPC
ncbi:GGDEF domain-containing protein [Thiohalospira sp.]|uniref:GGDEF domain-containing protein n=1 Tax=Thiohalospira sp. TaxID=3080549 RepID=UPI0039800339